MPFPCFCGQHWDIDSGSSERKISYARCVLSHVGLLGYNEIDICLNYVIIFLRGGCGRDTVGAGNRHSFLLMQGALWGGGLWGVEGGSPWGMTSVVMDAWPCLMVSTLLQIHPPTSAVVREGAADLSSHALAVILMHTPHRYIIYQHMFGVNPSLQLIAYGGILKGFLFLYSNLVVLDILLVLSKPKGQCREDMVEEIIVFWFLLEGAAAKICACFSG